MCKFWTRTRDMKFSKLKKNKKVIYTSFKLKLPAVLIFTETLEEV